MRVKLIGVPTQLVNELYDFWRNRCQGSDEAFARLIEAFKGLEVEAEPAEIESELAEIESEPAEIESEPARFIVDDLTLIGAGMQERCCEFGLWLSEAFSVEENLIVLEAYDLKLAQGNRPIAEKS